MHGLCRGNCFRGSTHKIRAKFAGVTMWVTTTKTAHSLKIDTGQDVADAASYMLRSRSKVCQVFWLACETKLHSNRDNHTPELCHAARSSIVADHYATKYLAKPQYWLASALRAMIAVHR